MFQNYLLTAFRNLRRNKTYATINLAGLATGLAMCMLIVLYVAHESNYDKFHRDADRICWVRAKIKNGNDSIYMPRMSYATASFAKESFPSIESFTRFMREGHNTIVQNPESPSVKFTEDKFLFADSNFFSFFSFKLSTGSAAQALREPFSIVISEKAAAKYFGTAANAVGKSIRYNNAYDFTVTAVAEDAPSNSSIVYDFVASVSSLSSIKGRSSSLSSQKVETGSFYTYFLLKEPNTSPLLETKLLQLYRATNPAGKDNKRFNAIPLTETHLMTNYGGTGSSKYLKIFPFVAALILLLALTNYMSLSTVRSAIRAKEIGVRKVMGARKTTIATQFFIESALHTAIAFAGGWLLCMFFRSFFFSFLQIDIDENFLYHPYVLVAFFILLLLSIVLAGAYPSMLLSAYKPVMVLYGKFSRQRGGNSMRKFFTVLQFSISVMLIICSVIIGKQLYFFRHADTGVSQENIILIPFTGTVGKHQDAFKKETGALAAVKEITVARYPLYDGYDMFSTKSKNGTDEISSAIISVDENFIPMMGLDWKVKPVNPQYYRNPKTVIINETALEKFGLKAEEAINEKITVWDEAYEVGGVLKDFNYESLRDKIDALCLVVGRDSASSWSDGGCLYARIGAGANIPSTIGQMKTIYEKYDLDRPFEYYFTDDVFESMYKAENRVSRVFNIFTSITVLIACLGLFGLSIFTVEQRLKEIGIRKVLGASSASVVSLLSKDFLKLVVLAVIIASPVAYYFMREWLNDFAYRTTINWWVFVLSGLATVLIAVVTVSFQSIRAALMNPVKSLRAD